MKVLCKYNELTEELALKFGAKTPARPRFSLTCGKTYVVLSVNVASEDPIYGSCSILDVIDDVGRLRPAPAYIFEIEDATPSIHWRAFSEDSFIGFAHPDLRIEFFADDLSEGVPDVVAKWEKIKRQFLSEQ